jgi:hypothetical protein
MALDEPKDTDDVFDVNGFQFIVDKEFYKKAQPSIEFDASCGSCSTAGHCGD